ncbi:5,10-methylenetetrahydrofolate reductase [Enterobacteriaceae endosymbiont of Plateumaris pusilla]|uniref:methylenetetrahydrofolate reductase n=1 Tax=Enterobacteriaceae endosymbiont of Plateumaris pusilla TaxID=2675795 RepID=UPI001449B029|nr:methylenetetrahydrofolate reductase [Enterobacteriaceae endosymbiont of Plateumaris pusilla]QJC29640.1 5,10-methylenetetrahydrofolate reductase [Enterobacteriaceae endosymbiont of Plateumaris pusilla]
MKYFCIENKEYIDKFFNKSLNKFNISFEIFPPSNYEIKSNFWKIIKTLVILKPKFISITTHNNINNSYKNTYNFVKKIQKYVNVELAPHITCINMKNDELYNIATKYWKNGIKHIVALRGDKIKSNKNINSLMYASDLVYFLKQIANFNISVAAYPEVHPESQNTKEDLINLKRKIDAGATKAITQFFFNIENYLLFRDKCISQGINIEIIPGILPITNFIQLKKLIKITNIKIPNYINNMFKNLNEQDENICKLLGSFIAIEMIIGLKNEGVNHFHFYTLNKSEIIYAICLYLGIKPKKIILN